jgi:hypothetical protein
VSADGPGDQVGDLQPTAIHPLGREDWFEGQDLLGQALSVAHTAELQLELVVLPFPPALEDDMDRFAAVPMLVEEVKSTVPGYCSAPAPSAGRIPRLPEVCRFFGLDPIEPIAGSLPRRQRRLVEAWAELHQDELLANWDRLQSGRLPAKIEPLR